MKKLWFIESEFLAAIATESVESVPCASPEPVAPLPEVQQLVAHISPPPVQIVSAPQPVQVIQKIPSAPYPAPLPFATHYGEPVVPLQYLLINNSI